MELIFLPDVSEQLDVAVAEGRGGPATPSVPAAGQGVGGARGHLLGAQLLQLTAGDGGVGLNLLGGGEGLTDNPSLQIPSCLIIIPTQQEPQAPWSLTSVTAFLSLQSTLSGSCSVVSLTSALTPEACNQPMRSFELF